MKLILNFCCLLSLLLLAVVTLGCDRSSTPPEPIALDQLPALMDKTFAKAKPEAKDLVAQINGALNGKDYAQAVAGLQKLSGMGSLSKDQSSVIARGIVAVNQALQDAQAKGDQKAAQTLKSYRINK